MLWECKKARNVQEGAVILVGEENKSDIQHSDDDGFDGDQVFEGLKQHHGVIHNLLRRVYRFRQSSFSYTGEGNKGMPDTFSASRQYSGLSECH